MGWMERCGVREVVLVDDGDGDFERDAHDWVPFGCSGGYSGHDYDVRGSGSGQRWYGQRGC